MYGSSTNDFINKRNESSSSQTTAVDLQASPPRHLRCFFITGWQGSFVACVYDVTNISSPEHLSLLYLEDLCIGPVQWRPKVLFCIDSTTHHTTGACVLWIDHTSSYLECSISRPSYQLERTMALVLRGTSQLLFVLGRDKNVRHNTYGFRLFR